MKIPALIISIVLPFLGLFSCKKDITNTQQSSTGTVTGTTNASTLRYQDSVFSSTNVISNINFGSAKTLAGNPENLLLDLYVPNNDTARHRPLVILVFGGGFTMGDKTTLSNLGKRFASYGYAAACTSYRLYDGPNPMTNTNLKKQILLDIQDIKATVRFFKKDASQFGTYGIDTNKIFLLGHSAGSMIVLHEAYMNSLNKIKQIDSAFLPIVQGNGGLEGNSGNPGYSSKVKGVINLSGALLFKNYVQTGDIPGLHIYGTEDNILPAGDGTLVFPGINPISLSGSLSINNQSGAVGVKSTLYGIPKGDHFSPLTNNTAFTDMIGFLYQNI